MEKKLVLSGESWALETSIDALLHASLNDKPVDSLALSEFDLDSTMAATVIQVLQKQEIKELSFYECTGLVDIVVTVALTKPNLESLSISIGHLVTTAFDPCANALGVGLQINSTLKKLVLQSGSNVFFTVSGEAASSLEQGLSGNTSLETLHIQSLRFGEIDAVRCLSRGLRDHRSLKDVKLRSCFVANGHSLDDDCIAALIRSLELSTHLQKLDVSGNKCLNHGISAVAKLIDRTNLKILNLSCQCIDQDDEFMNLSLLVAALGRTSTLESIELRFNKLTDQDMAYLAAALSHNTSIKYVGLASNKITNTGINILASRIPIMKGLERIVLTNNNFDQDGTQDLVRALQVNWTLQSVECDPTIANYKSVRYYADLNWGGRRFLLGQNYEKEVLPAVWPLVLARVNGIAAKENGKERQADILYCLLRDGPALFPM